MSNSLAQINQDFFGKLYQGYAAEHFVSSELFRRGFEVFRLPADFGFDLVVTNQFKATSSDTLDGHFPFAIQVKSRWTEKQPAIDDYTKRPIIEIEFDLKDEEIKLILSRQNAGLALVTFLGNGKSFQPQLVFITSSNLRKFEEEGFLLSAREQRFKTIRLQYRFHPEMTREEFVERLKKAGPLTEKQEAIIAKDFPPAIKRNWNASDYVAFARPGQRRDDFDFKQVAYVCTSFAQFPKCD